MTRQPARRVVLLSAPETLPTLDAAVRGAGVRFRRVVAIRAERCRPRVVASPSRPNPPVNTLVVTSRHAVGPALRRWTRSRRGAPAPEVWAAGPGTAEALRRFGFQRVRRGVGVGAEGIARRLGGRTRTIVHLRSDLAGEGFARRLRARGHRVIDVIAYRTVPATSSLRRNRVAIRRGDVLVLTSPSVVDALRRALGAGPVRSLGRTIPAVVLGGRTARAASRAGFRTVRIAPTTTPQRFARLLVRAVDDARAQAA